MIVAIGRFYLRPEKVHEFRVAWRSASLLLESKRGYLGHRLGRQCEDDSCYVLEVEWEHMDDQSEFMTHPDFEVFLHAIWPYFAADPDLYHFKPENTDCHD